MDELTHLLVSAVGIVAVRSIAPLSYLSIS